MTAAFQKAPQSRSGIPATKFQRKAREAIDSAIAIMATASDGRCTRLSSATNNGQSRRHSTAARKPALTRHPASSSQYRLRIRMTLAPWQQEFQVCPVHGGGILELRIRSALPYPQNIGHFSEFRTAPPCFAYLFHEHRKTALLRLQLGQEIGADGAETIGKVAHATAQQ